MRKLIRWIACALGVKSKYRITATMLIGGKSASSTMTIEASPWIHYDNISDIEDVFRKENRADTGVNLVMIYKIK